MPVADTINQITQNVIDTVPAEAIEVIGEHIEENIESIQDGVNWLSNNQQVIIDYSLNIVGSIFLILIGLFVARITSKAIHKVLSKQGLDLTIVEFVVPMIRYGIIILFLIASLAKLGVQTTSFAALIGAAGLAIGLALQGSLSNFASGILIVLLRPIKTGEFIEAAGVSGEVESVQIFSTILTTVDNKYVVVPNAQLLNGNIINYSRKKSRRIDLVIGVSYSADLALTKSVLMKVLEDNERVLHSPQPQVAVLELGDSSVNFVVRPWVRSSEYWPIRFEITEAIKNSLDEANIEIPFPQMDVHMNKE